jgi:5-methylcytosine-specific restriction endonuclease McrA
VNTLNESHDVAENAEKRIGELLLRGMETNALRDIESGEPWQKARAERTLSNINAAHTSALPQWLNRVLADQKNSKKDFKLLRAHRRGLLHYDRPTGWGYPKNWKEVASRIRQLDGFQCTACAAQDQTIDVHHIVYVSNFGTHQQTNLISLCRSCHEAEHKRNFDLGESEDEQAISSAEILMDTEGSLQGVEDLKPLQPSISASIPQQPPRQPNSQLTTSSTPLNPPAPTTSASPVRLEQTTTALSNAAVAQRFCGHCRTLVIPKRRFLLLKQCPNCEHAI